MYWEPEPSPPPSSKHSYKDEVETARPVILVHLAVGPSNDLRKFCIDEPMDLYNSESYPNIPRKLCPACRRLFINGLRRNNQ